MKKMNNAAHQDISCVTVIGSDSIRSSLETIRQNGKLGVFVIDSEGVLIGSLTDGDVRLEILKGLNIDIAVRSIMNPKPISVSTELGLNEISLLMREHSVLMLPRIDEVGVVVDYYHFFEISDSLFSMAGNVVESGAVRHQQKENADDVVVVIGGAGYIGSVLVRKLLAAGKRVRVLDSLLYGVESIEGLQPNDRFELIRGDVRDTEALVSTLRDADAVVHLGEIVGDPACAVNDTFTLDVNFLATKNIAEICVLHGESRMIFATTEPYIVVRAM